MINLFDTEWILQKAEASLKISPPHITDAVAAMSPGTKHEFYSNGDYWWPNPDTPNGLPYVRRDGISNPRNFNAHRRILRGMRTAVANLAAGYKITGDRRYAEHGVRILREFFLEEETCMAPHLKYAQAIPGVCEGRGIGIIDTLHLTEVPFAIRVFASSPFMTDEILAGLKKWFSEYLNWMNTHPNGIEERDYNNNHAICWHVQALSFAGFTGNRQIIDECVARYKNVILPNQMDHNGGFPLELARTKPYGYSIFVLDNLVTLVHLGTLYGSENLWEYELPDGRSVKRGLDFLLPYLEDRRKWFLPPDVEHDDAWPAREAFMALAAAELKNERYRHLYSSLPLESNDDEVRRNTAIRQPLLLLCPAERNC